MSNYIRISTLSIDPCEANKRKQTQSITDYVIEHLKKNIEQVLPDSPDLIVIPEVCDRPIDMPKSDRNAYFKERGDTILNALKKIARDNNTYLTYPAIRFLADGTARNSCQMIDRKGNVIGIYDKNHLMVEEITEGCMLPGNEATIFDCDFGKAAALICFDLNFKEIHDKIKKQKPCLTLFTSNYHGGIMQNYLAYYTRSYLVSAIGVRDNPSQIISPLGEQIATSTNYFNFVTADINLDYKICHLDYNWEKLANVRKKYGKKIKVHDCGFLGCVMITSETDEFTAADIVNEFEIELLDDYMDRALHYRTMFLKD